MLARFLDKTIIVRRLKPTTGNKKAFQATATVVGHYQNMDLKYRNEERGIKAQTYKAWFDIDEDIQEGDKLTDSNTNASFRVLEVEKMGGDFGLQTEHLEVIMEKYKN